MKINNTFKGIVVGVLSCAELYFITGFSIGFLATEDVWPIVSTGDYVKLYFLYGSIIIVTALFGLSIVRGYRILKNISLGLMLVIILIL